jgi:4-hydroxybenzoate polyprenyltransferase
MHATLQTGRLLTDLRPYTQLIRLPNVFTAFADIALGAFATHALPERWLTFLLLLLASGCLYCAGMVWNDFFDIEQDRRERPYRPIPAGLVPRRRAGRIGTVLLLLGVGFAFLASWPAFILALVLVGAILLYDGWLKRTWAGPLGMGACRFLNVLLGLTVLDGGISGLGVYLAAVVGIYIVGVTWFARTEARESKRATLGGAAAVMLAGLLLAIPVPAWVAPDTSSPLFPYLLVALGLVVGIPVYQAIEKPGPKQVQAAVKRAIMGLVLLDAVLATGLAGTVGLVILLLLVPALYLGKWLYST